MFSGVLKETSGMKWFKVFYFSGFREIENFIQDNFGV